MDSPQGTRPLGSTYRLQLNGLGFGGAQQLVPYLHQLGIETLYVSPILAAVPGSTHGYDVIDPTVVDPHLGTLDEFEGLLGALGSHGMRLLIDAVPNHMAADRHNRWWWDVQRRGTQSEDAEIFDIDWTQHGGRVLIPTLPAPLAEFVQKDEVTRAEWAGEPVLRIGDQAFPLDPHTLESGDDPASLLPRQHYRPAFWRLGRDEGNYRRFFDIDGLVGVKVERPEVRTRTHEFLLSLLADDRVAGLRIDHIDGLADPPGYLAWLKASWPATRSSPVTVLVEKILTGPETVPAAWEVDGTTGYEFASMAGGLFVDPVGADLLHEASARFTGELASFAELALEGKLEVLASSFRSPLQRLCGLLSTYLTTAEPGLDLSVADLEKALVQLVVQLPVYRTYFGSGHVTPTDRTTLLDCVAAACTALDGQGQRAARTIGDVLLGRYADQADPREIAQRWEQLSGAVMAKGVEDTASYRYAGLLSHAEVGSDPDRASCSIDEFFAHTHARGRHSSGLNATSTHDSKRGEDTRARLYALSEVASRWNRLVRLWHRRHTELLHGAPGPSPLDEWLIYQTLAGIWPLDTDTLTSDDWQRVSDYVIKAARESKRRTTWVDPDDQYEGSLHRFVELLGRPDTVQFRHELNRLIKRIAPSSVTSGLALTVLKSVCPGVPDFYQGTEFWTHTLTDPDNRRAVDFDARRTALQEISDFDPLATRWDDDRLKLLITQALLVLRREHPALFSEGAYDRIAVTGPLREHVVALSRRHRDEWVLAVVPRLMLQHLPPGRIPVGAHLWADTVLHLPAGAPSEFTNVFTHQAVAFKGMECEVARLLRQLPVAVLFGPAAHSDAQ
jgi:malto-oligosyltrehalose synthase